MRTNKQKNKGFTLVELIVVLVILAIMAAILVPALLGYIDRAKDQQIVLNARAVYTAAQAELTSMYAKGETELKQANTDRIAMTADVYTDDNKACCTIYVKGTSGHDAYTVAAMEYQETNGTTTKKIIFDGTSWDAENKVPTSASMFSGDLFSLKQPSTTSTGSGG